MFEKNVDLRNVALERDRAEAEAVNKVKNETNQTKDTSNKADTSSKNNETTPTENQTKENKGGGYVASSFPVTDVKFEEVHTENKKNGSGTKASSVPVPIGFDPQHVKTQVASVDALSALKGYRGKTTAIPSGGGASSTPVTTGRSAPFTDGKTKAVLEEIYKSQKTTTSPSGGETAYSTKDAVLAKLHEADEDMKKTS